MKLRKIKDKIDDKVDNFFHGIFTKKGYFLFNFLLLILACIDIFLIGDIFLRRRSYGASELIILSVWFLTPLHIFVLVTNKGVYKTRWIMFIVHSIVILAYDYGKYASIFEVVRMIFVYVVAAVFTIIVLKTCFKKININRNEILKKQHITALKIIISLVIIIRFLNAIRDNTNETVNYVLDIVLVSVVITIVVMVVGLYKFQMKKIKKNNIYIKKLVEDENYEEALNFLGKDKKSFMPARNNNVKEWQIVIYLLEGKNAEAYLLIKDMMDLYKGKYEGLMYYKLLFCLMDNDVDQADKLYKSIMKIKNKEYHHVKNMSQKIINVVKTGQLDDSIHKETKIPLVKEVYAKYVNN